MGRTLTSTRTPAGHAGHAGNTAQAGRAGREAGRVLRRASPVALVLAAATALAGCSADAEETRDYAVPAALCGAPVPAGLLTPFLPPGSKISLEDTAPVEGARRCNVSVDGELALVASRERWKQDEDLTKVAFAHAKLEVDESEGSGAYLYSGSGAVGRTKGCVDPAFPGQGLFTALQVYAPDRSDAKAMKGLITAYTRSVEKGGECAGG
ncbi:hypothetical protein EES43_11965 [Streptomyces sp. ADI96-02]|nr:hypothetical protein EES43_11965 [Streptomyces sp. ADI96-02]